MVVEAVWHGALDPEFEETTGRAMVMQLLSVDLVFFVGVPGLLVATGWDVDAPGQAIGRRWSRGDVSQHRVD